MLHIIQIFIIDKLYLLYLFHHECIYCTASLRKVLYTFEWMKQQSLIAEGAKGAFLPQNRVFSFYLYFLVAFTVLGILDDLH